MKKQPPWQKHELALLGKYPDAEVAARLNRAVRSVARQRQRRGIRCCPDKRYLTDAEIKLIGTMRDRDLAEQIGCAYITIVKNRLKLGISCFAGWKRRWTKLELKMLGKYPDAELARRLNRDPKRVRMQRLKKGNGEMRYKRWSKEELSLFTTCNAEDIAEKTGRPILAVYNKQAQLRRKIARK